MLVGGEHLFEVDPVGLIRPSFRGRAGAAELFVFDASDGIGEVRLIGRSGIGDGAERGCKSNGECKLSHYL